LLFMAPACLIDPGVTIVVVPYRALLDNLLKTAKDARIDCIEYRPGEQNPAALVFVSADFAGGSQFLSYAQLLSVKGVLRRVFVDESHLTFTASDWRPKLAEVRAVRGPESTPTVHYVHYVHYVMSCSSIRHDMNIGCLNMNMFIMSNCIEYDLR
jgi:superfamily II DNA helicase RecQ